MHQVSHVQVRSPLPVCFDVESDHQIGTVLVVTIELCHSRAVKRIRIVSALQLDGASREYERSIAIWISGVLVIHIHDSIVIDINVKQL